MAADVDEVNADAAKTEWLEQAKKAVPLLLALAKRLMRRLERIIICENIAIAR